MKIQYKQIKCYLKILIFNYINKGGKRKKKTYYYKPCQK